MRTSVLLTPSTRGKSRFSKCKQHRDKTRFYVLAGINLLFILKYREIWFTNLPELETPAPGQKKRTGQHPSFSLTKPIKLIKPKPMN